MVIKAKGIILRSVQVGENDKILTALIEGVGKASISAKGAKRMNSRILPLSQVFCCAEFELYEGKTIYSLNGGELIESFMGLRDDLVKFALASYISELVTTVTNEQSPDDGILRLTLNTLYALSRLKKSSALIKAAFELRLMCECGMKPELVFCRQCGEVTALAAFDLVSSAALCPKCFGAGREGAVILPQELLEALRYIVSCDGKKLFSFSVSAETEQKLSSFCEDYILRHIDLMPKTLTFYKGLSDF